ncbi:carbohydrate kinase family protein [Mobilicoccus caccae]|uniref:Carbohydrate kinase PfkB domain-containing protein n=1 Tax=Mobilicoccus caccae TaxID=1859295 RepID=A0ABQ6IKE2_9MICO|nr:carbohydrate kinase family protein [Mobilicoccus caccae]GMA38382.1 hypothetical protein GCM10025883_04270 [Mobilicoccus caccae]
MGEVRVTGHVCVDLIPHWPGPPAIDPGRLFAVGPLAFRLGGSACNTGRALTALGHDVSLGGLTGDDEVGGITKRLLQRETWTRLDLRTIGTASSYTLVIEAEGRDRSFWHYEGANAEFTAADVTADHGARVVHLGYPPLLPGLWANEGSALADRLTEIRRDGVGTSVDLAGVAPDAPASEVDWDAWLGRVGPACDLLAGSSDDLVSALGVPAPARPEDLLGLADRMLGYGPSVAVVSGGSLGFAVASHGTPAAPGPLTPDEPRQEHRFLVEAPHIASPVTTTGSGDVLKAALIDGLLARLPLREAALGAGRVTAEYVRTGTIGPPGFIR